MGFGVDLHLTDQAVFPIKSTNGQSVDITLPAALAY
ncbi:hypothetical protein JOJ88_003235 [Pantoea cypripedii]|nr:hypothetical protein [Pantoea cypripedii]